MAKAVKKKAAKRAGQPVAGKSASRKPAARKAAPRKPAAKSAASRKPAPSKPAPRKAAKAAPAKPVKGKWVYSFGDGKAEGHAGMRNLLGGKGANLAEMSALGLPVPPGFTITTEVCTLYYENKRQYPKGLREMVDKAVGHIERLVGAKFGDPGNPLLVSVRSGARASMPGMMDTVLNLGLTDRTVQGLAQLSNDPRFAYDSYRRFIQMYSDVVLGVGHDHFRERVRPNVVRVGFEHLGNISGCVVPAGGVRFLHQRYAAHTIPVYLADAVVGIGR